MNTKQTKLLTNDQGLASILVSMIMTIVITLLVVGFAKLASQEERQALDNQLAAQAYYAAESGINDVASFTPTALTNGLPNKTNCTSTGSSDPWNTFYTSEQMSLATESGNSKVQITCLLVNLTPPTLTHQFSNAGNSWTTPLYSFDPSNTIRSITFTLLPPSGTTNLANCSTDFQYNSGTKTYSLPTSNSGASYCGYAALRFDLVDVGKFNGSGQPTITTDGLLSNTMSALIVPQNSSGGSGINFLKNSTSSSTTDVYPFDSCTTGSCTITVLPLSPPDDNEYYLRAMLLYNSGTLQVSALKTNGATVNWSLGQVLVDATAKSQDEIKRLQATIPLSTSTNSPNFGIQTTKSLCKYFTIIPGSGPISQDTTNCPLGY